MQLPELPIPLPPAAWGIHIPETIHPLVVHFAVALPFLILLLELVNLFVRRRILGVTSFGFMVLLTLVLYATVVTGATDAKAALDTLGTEAKGALADHKQWGTYLFYASVVLMLVKLLSVLVRKTGVRVFFFIVLLLFAAATLATGKRGGALVYRYGVNVAASHAPSQPTAAGTSATSVSEAAGAAESTGSKGEEKKSTPSAVSEPAEAEPHSGESPAAIQPAGEKPAAPTEGGSTANETAPAAPPPEGENAAPKMDETQPASAPEESTSAPAENGE
ncbi:DUF2231 domain-containing protein [Nitratifractor sp.]